MIVRTCSWSLHGFGGANDIVFIVDNDLGGMSVTNAANLVCRQVVEQYGDRPIVYRDSMGRWDELRHRAGSFIGFAPFNGEVPS